MFISFEFILFLIPTAADIIWLKRHERFFFVRLTIVLKKFHFLKDFVLYPHTTKLIPLDLWNVLFVCGLFPSIFIPLLEFYSYPLFYHAADKFDPEVPEFDFIKQLFLTNKVVKMY